MIFPSTGGAVYGQTLRRRLSETDYTEPISPYAIGKLAIEGYLRYLQRTTGLSSVARYEFRIHTVHARARRLIRVWRRSF